MELPKRSMSKIWTILQKRCFGALFRISPDASSVLYIEYMTHGGKKQ